MYRKRLKTLISSHHLSHSAQEIRFEVQLFHPWREEMVNKSSPAFKLLVGTLKDAFRNELNADLNFITSSVLKLK